MLTLLKNIAQLIGALILALIWARYFTTPGGSLAAWRAKILD